MILLIFIVLFLGGILGFVFREKVQVTMKQQMESSMRNYGSKREATEAWDKTQETLKCCGAYSPDDWRGYTPESCCREPVPGKKQACRDSTIVGTRYESGCLKAAVDFIMPHAIIIGAVGVCGALFLVRCINVN